MSSSIAIHISRDSRWLRTQRLQLRDPLIVGSAPGCDVVLDDIGVRHAIMMPVGSKVKLVAGPGFDVRIGGMPVRETLAIEAGRFEVGPYQLEFEVEPEFGAERHPAAGRVAPSGPRQVEPAAPARGRSTDVDRAPRLAAMPSLGARDGVGVRAHGRAPVSLGGSANANVDPTDEVDAARAMWADPRVTPMLDDPAEETVADWHPGNIDAPREESTRADADDGSHAAGFAAPLASDMTLADEIAAPGSVRRPGPRARHGQGDGARPPLGGADRARSAPAGDDTAELDVGDEMAPGIRLIGRLRPPGAGLPARSKPVAPAFDETRPGYPTARAGPWSWPSAARALPGDDTATERDGSVAVSSHAVEPVDAPRPWPAAPPSPERRPPIDDGAGPRLRQSPWSLFWQAAAGETIDGRVDRGLLAILGSAVLHCAVLVAMALADPPAKSRLSITETAERIVLLTTRQAATMPASSPLRVEERTVEPPPPPRPAPRRRPPKTPPREPEPSPATVAPEPKRPRPPDRPEPSRRAQETATAVARTESKFGGVDIEDLSADIPSLPPIVASSGDPARPSAVGAIEPAADGQASRDSIGPGRKALSSPRKVKRRIVIQRDSVPEIDGGTEKEREAIRKAVGSRWNGFRNCYDRALVRLPELQGKMRMSFDITAAGAPSRVGGRLEPKDDGPLSRCFVAELQKVRIERENAAPIRVNYTFTLGGL